MPVVLLAATLALLTVSLPPPSLPQLWVTPPDTEPDGPPLWTWPDRSTQLPSPTCTTSAVRLSPLPSSTSTTLPVRPLPLPSPTSTTPPVRSTPPPSPTSTSSPSQPQLPSPLPPQLLPMPLLQLLLTPDTPVSPPQLSVATLLPQLSLLPPLLPTP